MAGDITKNFSREEFECRCGCGQNHVKEELVGRLQALRNFVGFPIRVSSGVRCESHNAAIGGEKNSYHIKGMAADVFSDEAPLAELLDKAKTVFSDGGIGVYVGDDEFLHLDIRDGSARWGYHNGEAVGYNAAVAIAEGESDVGLA